MRFFLIILGGVPKCNCCDVVGINFLTLDHVNNDGNKFRGKKQRFSGYIFYRWAQKNGFPKDLQVLCYNCNNARYWNGGVCPHKQNVL